MWLPIISWCKPNFVCILYTYRYLSLQIDNGTSNMDSSVSKWILCIILFIGIGFSHSTNSLDVSQSNLLEVPISPADQVINTIILDWNNIEELFSYSFVNYDELTRISIASNGLQKIHDGTFDNIHNLWSLNLKLNNIVQLPVNFGPSTAKLFSID